MYHIFPTKRHRQYGARCRDCQSPKVRTLGIQPDAQRLIQLARAVGGGIRAMIPLQGALAARTGALGAALATAALAPLAKALSRRVNPT